MTAIFPPGEIVQYYALKEISDISKKDAFCKKIYAVVQRLPKGEIVMVVVDLNHRLTGKELLIRSTMLQSAVDLNVCNKLGPNWLQKGLSSDDLTFASMSLLGLPTGE